MIAPSLEDILADDDMGIFDEDEDIFTLKHVTNTADEIASRSPCEYFADFAESFKQCQQDLAEGKRKLIDFSNEQQIFEGQFFVLRGVLGYVDAVGKRKRQHGKTNARLRCIFENGTESNMLLRSLAVELYKNGRRVTEHEDKLLEELKGVNSEDQSTGFIYILKSLSKNPEIASMPDLYKVGFTRTTIKDRLKDAENDPTYLMAPVQLVAEYQCYNLNPQKLEKILHNLFGAVCLEIDVFSHGKRHAPREWFKVRLEVINEAIRLIIN